MPIRFSTLLGTASLFLFLVAPDVPVLAQEAVISIEGDATLISDYSFRGISRSDKGVAVQGGLDLVHNSGLYLGAFVSTIDDTRGHDVELETHIGFGMASGAYDIDFRVNWDSFHGNGDSSGFLDFQGSVSRDFGLAYVTGGMSFTPDNREFGGGHSVYTFGEAEMLLPLPKLPPMSLALHMGYEDFEGGFDKWDWSAGIFAEVVDFELGLGYYDTNLDNFRGADSRVILSIRKYF